MRDAVAAGGVVLRASARGREVVIAGREGMWVLPKGTPDHDERIEETATREVREETGLDVRIVRPLGTIEYWFALPRQRIHKTVQMLSYQPCPYCQGRGRIKSPITIAIYALKELKRYLKEKPLKQVNLTLAPKVIEEILKDKESLRSIEHKFRTRINLVSNPASHIEEIKIA